MSGARWRRSSHPAEGNVEIDHVVSHPIIVDGILIPLAGAVAVTILLNTGKEISGGVLAFVVFVALIIRRSVLSTANDSPTGQFTIDILLGIVGAVLALVFITLISDPTQSILYRLSYGGFQASTQLPPSFIALDWALTLSLLTVRRRVLTAQKSEKARYQNPALRVPVAVWLGLFGTVGILFQLSINRSIAFAERGSNSGEGLQNILYWSAAAFVAYVVITWSRGNARWFPAIATAMTVGMFLSGNRSPLAFIAVAMLVRVVLHRQRKTLMVTLSSIPLVLGVFAFQALWRALIARHDTVDIGALVGGIVSSPGRSLVRLGLDSIDGHSLATGLIDKGFQARPWDPFVALLNFVPRSIWPGKPGLLGSQIGLEYLGTTNGGIFLSGPGYFALVTGSSLLGVALFVVTMWCLKWVGMTRIHPFLLAVVTYLAARLMIAGDAFDIFLSLQLSAIFAICSYLGNRVFVKHSANVASAPNRSASGSTDRSEGRRKVD